jgi:hypothetical protein
LWAALLVQLVLTFPQGRSWSRLARGAIVGAYALTLGGQLVGSLVAPDARDVLSVASHPNVAEAIDRARQVSGVVVALAVLFLVVRRLGALGGPARPAQGPLLLAAAVTALSGLVWLGWLIATDARATTGETIARTVAVTIPLGIVAGVVWSRLRHRKRPSSLSSCEASRRDLARTPCTRARRPHARGCLPARDGRHVDAAGSAD